MHIEHLRNILPRKVADDFQEEDWVTLKQLVQRGETLPRKWLHARVPRFGPPAMYAIHGLPTRKQMEGGSDVSSICSQCLR